MKNFKKIYKWVFIIVASFVFLIIAAIALLSLRSVQNYIVQKATVYLSNELKTTVKIKSIDFKFLNRIQLNGLYIEDLHNDTLGYFDKLDIGFNYKILFSKKLNLASVNKVKIKNSVIKFIKYNKQRDFNYQFLVDYFTVPNTNKTGGKDFSLIIKKVSLENVKFILIQGDKSPPDGRAFDENYLVFNNIYSDINSFKLIGDSIVMNIDKFIFKEKSGLTFTEFSSKTTISSSVMEFNELHMKTPESEIKNYVKLTYNGWNSFSDFEKNVQMKFDFDNSEISTRDISYFSNYLKNYNFKTSISGTVKGTLASIKSINIKLKVGELNTIEGSFEMKNLTNTDNLSYNLYLSKMTLNPSNIQQLIKYKFPDELLRIGSINYLGTLKGTLQNINSIGLFETTVGNIRTDVGFVFKPGKVPEYKGEIDVFALNTGKVLNTYKTGFLTMFSKIEGKGFTIKDVNTKLISNIDNFEYKGYKYVNATLDGIFEKKKFTGNFNIDDPNANFNLTGNFDFNEKEPTGSFLATSDGINLKTLGYSDINISKLSDVNIEFEGDDIDNISVHAILSKIELEKFDEIFSIENIKLDAFGEYTNRSIQLSSDLGNISLSGNFKLSEVNKISSVFLYNLFPEFYAKEKFDNLHVDIRFDTDINNSRFLTPLFFPDIKFSGFTCTGVYNSQNQNLDLVAMADNFSYKNYSFNEINIQSQKNPDKKLALLTSVENVNYNDSLFTRNIELDADIGMEDIEFSLKVSDTSDNISLNTTGQISLIKETIGFKFINSSIYIYKNQWKISEENYLTYNKNSISIDSFKITNGLQYLLANGKIINNEFNGLDLDISKFSLDELNPLLCKKNISLKGIANSKISLNGNISKPVIKSEISIKDLFYNNDSVGDVELTTLNSESKYKMDVFGKIKNGFVNNLTITGNIDVTPEKERLNLFVSLNNTSIKPFETFTKGLFSNIKGIIDTAVLKINSDFKKIETYGEIIVNDASMFMDYLGVPLIVNKAKIKINNNEINLGEFEVADKYGSKAIAGGKIFHKNFEKMRYAIFMKDLKNFNCMNLTEEQGKLFFGNAFVDGNMVLSGTINDLYLNINAKSRPKTVISLPLVTTTETTGPDYIKIVDLRGTDNYTKTKSLTGITMDFNFNITDDAEVRLIFDSKFDDVIKATGEGSIKMELTTYGDFYIYGSYIIDKGSYNFTALNNLVNKNLKVKKGGKIIWNGNPYEAVVDLMATTTVSADPSVIIPNINPAGINNTVGINCNISLKDNLFHPQINLGIDISDENQSTLFSNADLTNAINLIKTDQEEINKQFINLLVFNSFAPTNPGISTATTSNLYSSVQNSIGAFMTTQVNNWLRQIDPNWELGIDWSNSGNTETQKQIMVSLKRKLFNERIEVGGVYGQAGISSYDVNLSYKIKQDGRLRLRGFNRRATDPLSGNNTYINSSGVGLYYRKELDYLFPKFRKKIYEKKHN